MSDLSIYDELVWDRANVARPEIPTLTLGDALAVLSMHEATLVSVEVWADYTWGGIDSLSVWGFLSLNRGLSELGEPLPLECDAFYYDLQAPAVPGAVKWQRIGRFTVDGMAFESAMLQGHSASDPASLYIHQCWREEPREPRLRLAVRFYGARESS